MGGGRGEEGEGWSGGGGRGGMEWRMRRKKRGNEKKIGK